MRWFTLLLLGAGGAVGGYLLGRHRYRKEEKQIEDPPERDDVPNAEEQDLIEEAKKRPELRMQFARELILPVSRKIDGMNEAETNREMDRLARLMQKGFFTIEEASAIDWQMALLIKQRLDPLGIGDFSDIGVEENAF